MFFRFIHHSLAVILYFITVTVHSCRHYLSWLPWINSSSFSICKFLEQLCSHFAAFLSSLNIIWIYKFYFILSLLNTPLSTPSPLPFFFGQGEGSVTFLSTIRVYCIFVLPYHWQIFYLKYFTARWYTQCLNSKYFWICYFSR